VTKHALTHLEHCVNDAYRQFIQARISGSISEVTPAYARVVGLSRFLKLAECVTFSADGCTQLAEVVQVDEHGATVKAFDNSVLACLGERVYRSEALRILPHQSWKGRVISALGLPIDAQGPLNLGERAMEIDAPPPPAMRRSRVCIPLKTGVREIDLFAPLCAGQRIGIFLDLGLGNQPFWRCSQDHGILIRS
jgi:flagellum-specific ATP synthase